jgi:hypothetical protein
MSKGILVSMISTRDLSQVPSIHALKNLTQSLAMLDAIIERDWDGRYYSFNAHWAIGQQLASMRNGEGDEWFCIFTPAGALLKGLYHESAMTLPWPLVLESVPAVFKPVSVEPAFSIEYTTFCIWRTYRDDHWHNASIFYRRGDDPDGSALMLAILDGNPATYQRWAENYYKRSIRLSSVERIYAHQQLTNDIVRSLNAQISISDLAQDIAKIGYPRS